MRLCANLLIPFSFVVAVAGIFFSSDIMHLLYKGANGGSSREYEVVFSWLIASFPAWCIMYIYSTLLTANGNLKTLNFIALGGVILNLSLNFYLIPRFNATGGAITSFVTQSTLSLAFVIYCTRILKLPVNIRWIASLIGYLGIVVLSGYLTITFLLVHWMIQITLFMLICLLLMFIFRFVSIAGIKQLSNKREATL